MIALKMTVGLERSCTECLLALPTDGAWPATWSRRWASDGVMWWMCDARALYIVTVDERERGGEGNTYVDERERWRERGVRGIR